MASIEECWLEIENYDKEWAELKPFLIKYLPRDLAKVNKAERLIAKRRRYFEQGSQAEKRKQKLPAFWWYCQVLAASRYINKFVDVLGEQGIQAQEKAKRQRKASA